MVIKSISLIISNAFYVFTAMVFAVFSAQAEIPFSESQGVLAATKDDFKGKGPFEAFVALNGGLLKRLRLYGLDEQPIGELLKQLFPSPDGSLFTAQTNKNHPAYDMVSDPKVFADTFQFLNGEMDEKKLVEEMLTILDKKLIDNKTKDTNVSQYNTQIENQKEAIQDFLTTLKAAHDAQGKSKDQIYPNNIVETSLFAYFIKTFNDREDLNKLSFVFDKKFSEKDAVFSKKDYEENKKNIAEFFKKKDLEKLYLMSVGYEAYEQLFSSPIVYRGDVLYLEDPKNRFADCMETMLRNLIYFWIMDPVTKKISEDRLTEIEQKLTFDINAKKDHFKALFAHLKEHPSLLYATNQKIHGEFVDKVVGDLNDYKQAQSLNDVLYYKTTKKKNGQYFEIGSDRNAPTLYGKPTPDLETDTPVGEGIYNALNVLAKLFPDKILTAKWDVNLAKRAKQAEEKLNRLCEIFSTDDHQFDWKPKPGQELEDKFLTIEFYVNRLNRFSMKITETHGQLRLVKNAKNDWRDPYEDADLPDEFMASLYLRAAPSESADKNHAASRMFNPMIDIFYGAIGSMEFLLKKTKISDDIKTELIEYWIKKSIPLDDVYAQRHFHDFLYACADYPAVKDIVKQVTTLKLKSNINFKKLAKFSNVKNLDLSESDISDISGLEYLTALEHLHLSITTNLKGEIKFSAANKNLKYLGLSQSGITKLKGLEYLPALRYLDLSHTKNLQEGLKFSSANKNLYKLSLSESGIQKLEGLEHLTELEKLDMIGTKGLKFYFPKHLQKDEATEKMISKFKIKPENIVWVIPEDIISL